MELIKERKIRVSGDRGKIEGLVSKLEGVRDARFSDDRLKVTYDLEKIRLYDINKELSQAGYDVKTGMMTKLAYRLEKNQYEASKLSSCSCCCR